MHIHKASQTILRGLEPAVAGSKDDESEAVQHLSPKVTSLNWSSEEVPLRTELIE